MKEIDFRPLHQWTSKGLKLSNGDGETFRSADDTNSFAMLVGHAVRHIDPRLVVDLGCGCGIPTVEAAARGARQVHGVDISEANAALARRNVSLAGLEDRVDVHCGDWRVLLEEARPDLIVSNPPYVPQGSHPTVDGGPDGAGVVRAMVDAAPDSTRGLALLFGSISNPVSVVRHIEGRGWRVRWLSGHVVPFGLYTSRPTTVRVLRALRSRKRAWFHEARLDAEDTLRTYIVFGVIAERGTNSSSLADAMTCLLVKFQSEGGRALQNAVMPVPFDCGIYCTAMPGEGALHGRLNGSGAKTAEVTNAIRSGQRASATEHLRIDPVAVATDPGLLRSDSEF